MYFPKCGRKQIDGNLGQVLMPLICMLVLLALHF